MFQEKLQFGQRQHGQAILGSSNQVLLFSITVCFIHSLSSSLQSTVLFSCKHGLSLLLFIAFSKVTNVFHTYQSLTRSSHWNAMHYTQNFLPITYITAVRHDNVEVFPYILPHSFNLKNCGPSIRQVSQSPS